MIYTMPYKNSYVGPFPPDLFGHILKYIVNRGAICKLRLISRKVKAYTEKYVRAINTRDIWPVPVRFLTLFKQIDTCNHISVSLPDLHQINNGRGKEETRHHTAVQLARNDLQTCFKNVYRGTSFTLSLVGHSRYEWHNKLTDYTLAFLPRPFNEYDICVQIRYRNTLSKRAYLGAATRDLLDYRQGYLYALNAFSLGWKEIGLRMLPFITRINHKYLEVYLELPRMGNDYALKEITNVPAEGVSREHQDFITRYAIKILNRS